MPSSFTTILLAAPRVWTADWVRRTRLLGCLQSVCDTYASRGVLGSVCFSPVPLLLSYQIYFGVDKHQDRMQRATHKLEDLWHVRR